MTARSIDPDPGWLGKTAAVLLQPSVILGVVTLALHVAANGAYGFFRDELYFIVGGQRLACIDSPYAMPYETNLSIYVLRGIRAPLDWRTVKHYD